MSANDQILGNVGGEEAMAIDGEVGADTEPTGTVAVDNAGEASQSGDSDAVNDNAVDSGAAGSATRPVDDPSVPPANGAERLTALPNEVQHLISTHSDLMARHSIGLSCTALRQNTDAPPPMSRGDYIEFQKQLEIHSSRKLRHLYCPSCDTFKKPTPSKTTFTDAQAVQNHSGRRFCIECGIANGHFDRRDVVIKKKKLFLCGGCKLLLPHEKEEGVIADAVFTKAYPYRDSGWGQGAEITIDSGRKRWCKPCRAVIANLGESGAVKVRQVYIR